MSKKNKEEQGNRVIVGDLPINIALRKFKQKVDDSGILERVDSIVDSALQATTNIPNLITRIVFPNFILLT